MILGCCGKCGQDGPVAISTNQRYLSYKCGNCDVVLVQITRGAGE